MKKTFPLLLLLTFFLPIIHVHGAEKTFSFSPVFRYYFVDQDTKKFRELNDTKRNFIGGLDQLLLTSPLGSVLDLNLDIEKALIENNEYRGTLNIFNKNDRDLFDFTMGINAFNRYYDTTGGHHSAITPSSFEIDRDLTLFDGKFFATVKAPIFNFAHMDLEYLWHHKQGKSANLNWGTARTAPGYTGNSRKFVPGFTNLRRENLHEFSLNLSKEIRGYEIEFGNDLSILRENPIREEHNKNAAQPSTARQTTALDGLNYATTLKTLKYFSDRFIGSFVYRFEKGSSKERENLLVFNSVTGAQVTGSHNRFGAEADSKISQHIWSVNLLSDLGRNFFLTTRGRFNLKSRRSEAIYPMDTGVDGIANTTNYIDTKDRGFGLGEQLSLTYKGMAAFTPYIKAESEQNYLELIEDQVNVAGQSAASTSSDFFRSTDQGLHKYLVTAGFYSYPYRWLKLSAQGISNSNIDNYTDTREIPASATSDKSSFMELMRIRTYGIKTTASIRPLSWLYTDYRLQLSQIRFRMQQEAAHALFKSYTYTQKHTGVLTIVPWDYLMLTESFTHQKLSTETPASSDSNFELATKLNLPKNKSGFNTLLSSLVYDIGDKLSLKADYQKTWSKDNFIDFSANGLPSGIDHRFDNLHLEAGWKVRKNLEITPSYETGLYRISSRSNIDDYNYHLAEIKATLKNF